MKKLALLMCVASLFLMNCSMQKKGTNKYVEFNNQNTNLENKQLNSSVSFFPAEDGEMSGKMMMMGSQFDVDLRTFEMKKEETTVLYKDLIVKSFLRDSQKIVMAGFGGEEVVDEHGPLEGEEVMFQKSEDGAWIVKDFSSYNEEQKQMLKLEKAKLNMTLADLNYIDIKLPDKVKMNKKYKISPGNMGNIFDSYGNNSGFVITLKLKYIENREGTDYAIFDMTMKIKLETKNPYTKEELKMEFDMSGDYALSMDGNINSETTMKCKMLFQMSAFEMGQKFDMTFLVDGIFQRSISIEEAPEYNAASIGKLMKL